MIKRIGTKKLFLFVGFLIIINVNLISSVSAEVRCMSPDVSSNDEHMRPDLIACLGINNVQGYCFKSDFKYPINANGQTYGPGVRCMPPDVSSNDEHMGPDLIACLGINDVQGYCFKSDLDGELPNTPEEAIEYMENIKKLKQNARENGEEYIRYIPLYESDGETIIGSFGI